MPARIPMTERQRAIMSDANSAHGHQLRTTAHGSSDRLGNE